MSRSAYNPVRDRALTERQREVMGLISRGFTNGQIAEELGISLDGAKFHVAEILSRLGAATREEAVVIWANETSLLKGLQRAFLTLPLWKTVSVAAVFVLGGVGAVLAIALFNPSGGDADGPPEAAATTPSPAATASGLALIGQTEVQKYVANRLTAPESYLPVECFGRSIASERADAWRCTGGSTILDPCFALAADSVVCEMNPATGHIAIQHLATGQQLEPANASDVERPPWLLLLADGSNCQRMTGTRGIVNGAVTTFLCSDGAWLLGEPRPGRVWEADKYSSSGGTVVIAIAKAWW